MAVPVPYNWAGVAPSASQDLNPGVRDPLVWLLDPPHCKAYRATSGAAFTSAAVNLDGEQYDSTGTMHSLSSNLSRIVVPEDGLYTWYGQINAALGGTGSVLALLRINGSTDMVTSRTQSPTAGNTVVQLYVDWPCSAGDYVEMFATFPSSNTPTPGVSNTYVQATWRSRQ